jgi:hypothetical protein
MQLENRNQRVTALHAMLDADIRDELTVFEVFRVNGIEKKVSDSMKDPAAFLFFIGLD